MTFFRTLAALTLATSIATVPASGYADLLIDDNVQISPAKVRPLDFDVSAKGTRVLCTYHVEAGRSGVRAVLMKRGDIRLWLAGRAHSVLTSTPYADSGGFSWLVAEPGAYSIVLDNRLDARDNAVVRLQVRLISGQGINVPVQRAIPTRAHVVVWISLFLFALFALLSGWRIQVALERRRVHQAAPSWLHPSW